MMEVSLKWGHLLRFTPVFVGDVPVSGTPPTVGVAPPRNSCYICVIIDKKRMKRFFAILAAMSLTLTAAADEGMWLLPLLQKMNGKALHDAGCKLSMDDIYSINHSSLKDNIVHFGGGCTGEIISAEGLIVTNHHCGYSSIQALST